jgi:CRISPR-associated protein Cmr3
MSTQHLALLPRDGLFLKDGRGWYTSDIGRSHAHPWPLPPTVRGALRAAIGRGLMKRSGRDLSPAEWERETEAVSLRRVLSLRRPLAEPFRAGHRMWPTPADALYPSSGADVIRLDPIPPKGSTLGSAAEPWVETLWRPYPGHIGKPRQPPAFWPEADMLQWLRGEPVGAHRPGDPALRPERRAEIHVTIDRATQTAAESMMSSRRSPRGVTSGRSASSATCPPARPGRWRGP